MMKQLGIGTRMGMLTLLLAVASGIVLASSASAPTPAVVGDWNGAISPGSGSLRVVIHVAQSNDGKLTATMDSPDQGATGIAMSSITFKDSALHFEIEKFSVAYDGAMNKDNSEISGTWKQGTASVPLTFKRASK